MMTWAGRAALLVVFAALAGAQDPAPPVGRSCHGCKCGDMDLHNYRGHEFRTPADEDGYVTMFQMCEEIPAARLPDGCKPIPSDPNATMPHPAVVRFKETDATDCEMLGSFGPCGEGPCGMTYLPTLQGKPFSVTWQYQLGCTYTFRIYLEEGDQDAPSNPPQLDPGDQYECYWTMHWPSLNAFSPASRSWVTWVIVLLLVCGLATAAAVVYKKRQQAAKTPDLETGETPYSSLGAE